ncbi:MAG: DUF11 domain-containing protein, partial [Proteobacteria bacterium]|nr:DUF11 domain-containing protein [Pseudomonadota bacterium]
MAPPADRAVRGGIPSLARSPGRRGWRHALLGLGLLALSAVSAPADAAWIKRYANTAPGAITFTGNTLGLDKATGYNNRPGTNGSVGGFITTNTASQVGRLPYGTTTAWASNSSSAVLRIPAGSTVLYAELIWGGSYYVTDNSSYTQDLTSSVPTPVSLKVGSAAPVSISPAAATAQTDTSNSTRSMYVNSANVTAQIQAAGTGAITVTVAGVPATNNANEENSNAAGWTLAVAYSNATMPPRNLSIFVGAEASGAAPAQINGFCTPGSGALSARVAVSAMEGDAFITGDTMKFGATNPPTTTLSGPNNPANNFFASQMNDDNGNLDTSGTFGVAVTSNVGGNNYTAGGNHNAAAGKDLSGGRQGWDITNVDGSAALINGQTTAYAQGTTTGDVYTMSAIGMQINVFAPSFPIVVKTVDKATAAVGDTLTYTITLNNQGAVAANNIVFNDAIPAGTTFVAGSLKINNVVQANPATPVTGLAIGTINAGATTTVVFQVQVASGAVGSTISNQAHWDYTFSACGTLNGHVDTNTVTTTITANPPTVTKAFAPATISAGGTSVLTITLTNNNATAATLSAALVDTLPSGMTLANATFGGTCLGTKSGTAGGNTVTYASGATIPGGAPGTCTITANVTSSTPGA